MDLQLIVPSVPALDEFSRALEQTRRFDVEIEAANQNDCGNRGAPAHRRSQSMKAWFFGLQPRERWIVVVGAARRRRHHSLGLRRAAAAQPRSLTLRTAVDTKQRLLVDVARVEGAQPSAVATAGRERSKRSSSSSTIRRATTVSILPRTRANGPSGVDVTFQGASFDALVAWLLVLHATYGVDVETASFSSAREPGLVNGQLSLQRL